LQFPPEAAKALPALRKQAIKTAARKNLVIVSPLVQAISTAQVTLSPTQPLLVPGSDSVQVAVLALDKVNAKSYPLNTQEIPIGASFWSYLRQLDVPKSHGAGTGDRIIILPTARQNPRCESKSLPDSTSGAARLHVPGGSKPVIPARPGRPILSMHLVGYVPEKSSRKPSGGYQNLYSIPRGAQRQCKELSPSLD